MVVELLCGRHMWLQPRMNVIGCICARKSCLTSVPEAASNTGSPESQSGPWPATDSLRRGQSPGCVIRECRMLVSACRSEDSRAGRRVQACLDPLLKYQGRPRCVSVIVAHHPLRHAGHKIAAVLAAFWLCCSNVMPRMQVRSCVYIAKSDPNACMDAIYLSIT